MQTEKKPIDKISIGLLIAGIIGVIGGLGFLLFGIFGLQKVTENVSFPQLGNQNTENAAALSPLTGEILADGATVNDPTYCIQTPNGLDGARPQAGLTEAGVVFEAIAEAGITRFAAIYQDPSSAVIGPIRSLRLYYLEWDTPFDCTIVHAGGADDAIMALQSGGYREIDENYNDMYRSNVGGRLWNNLFTTSSNLARATAGETSNAQGFSRMTPEESGRARVDAEAAQILNITEPAEGDTSKIEAEVANISIDFGGAADFSVIYDYNADNNTYARSYASGATHDVYECTSEDLGNQAPEQVCSLTQLSPSVVIAMVVKESKASDNYHEDITTIGTGDAYIFQNGTVIEGSWGKASVADQIKFFDENGDEVKLAVGQTFVSAIPTYGRVDYQ